MDWILDLSQNIATSLDTEGVIMAMQEDAFDFVEHQLRTVGNSIGNQFQTVSANIENQLQIIRANIQRHRSAFNLCGAKSKVVDAGNKKIKSTVLESSMRSLDLSGQEASRSAVNEDEIIKPKAPESPMLITEINSGKGLEKSSVFLSGSDEENSKVADVEDENIDLTAPESTMLSTKINSKKELEKSTTFIACSKDELFKLVDVENKNIETTAPNSGKGLKKSLTFLDDSDSDDSSIADKYSEEFRGQKCVQYVDDSDYEMCHDAHSEDFTHCRFMVHNVKEPRFGEVCALGDGDGLCSLCFKKFTSYSEKRITCEACFAKAKLIDQQECEQPAPDSESLNNDLNLLEDECSVPSTQDEETADFNFCDSDWEIVSIHY